MIRVRAYPKSPDQAALVSDGRKAQEAQRERPGALPGSVDSRRVATTVSAALGQWVELGGVQSSGIVSERRGIWVKVEEIGR